MQSYFDQIESVVRVDSCFCALVIDAENAPELHRSSISGGTGLAGFNERRRVFWILPAARFDPAPEFWDAVDMRDAWVHGFTVSLGSCR